MCNPLSIPVVRDEFVMVTVGSGVVFSVLTSLSLRSLSTNSNQSGGGVPQLLSIALVQQSTQPTASSPHDCYIMWSICEVVRQRIDRNSDGIKQIIGEGNIPHPIVCVTPPAVVETSGDIQIV